MAARAFLTTTVPADPPVPGPETWTGVIADDLAAAPAGTRGVLTIDPGSGAMAWRPPDAADPGGGVAVAVGEVRGFAGPVPAGWVDLTRSPLPRAAWPDLFAAIGTAYGTGDGSTTFDLPARSGFSPGSPFRYAVWPGRAAPDLPAPAVFPPWFRRRVPAFDPDDLIPALEDY